MILRALTLALFALAAPVTLWAEAPLRIATWHVELERKGPGLLLRDILGDTAPDLRQAEAHITALSPDILLLTGIDTDLDGQSAIALAARLDYPYVFTRWGNTGEPTGRDIDKDGRLGEPEDAQSYGTFRGQGGMMLLSRLPIVADEVVSFSDLLWRDLPGALVPDGYFDAEDLAVLKLSSHAHWDVPILWGEHRLNLLTYAATSPVFDGEEDRNGRRNADETRFWSLYLDGELEQAPLAGAFVILGNSNLDPNDGDGRREVMRDLLSDPRLQDPKPVSDHGPAANPEHRGDHGLDTADWTDPLPGNLRVDYVLPSADLTVQDAGVAWVSGDSEKNDFRHGLVWVDIAPIP